MIDGVVVKPLVVHADVAEAGEAITQPGFLMEVLRDDDRLLRRFGQTTFTVAYPGTIKAFHWHARQDDLWFVASGTVRWVLYDVREGWPSKGKTDVLTAGAGNYKLIVIPVGVAHGYQVIGNEPVLLFYHTTESYDPKNPDEQRIAHDDPKIGFNWGSMK